MSNEQNDAAQERLFENISTAVQDAYQAEVPLTIEQIVQAIAESFTLEELDQVSKALTKLYSDVLNNASKYGK